MLCRAVAAEILPGADALVAIVPSDTDAAEAAAALARRGTCDVVLWSDCRAYYEEQQQAEANRGAAGTAASASADAAAADSDTALDTVEAIDGLARLVLDAASGGCVVVTLDDWPMLAVHAEPSRCIAAGPEWFKGEEEEEEEEKDGGGSSDGEGTKADSTAAPGAAPVPAPTPGPATKAPVQAAQRRRAPVVPAAPTTTVYVAVAALERRETTPSLASLLDAADAANADNAGNAGNGRLCIEERAFPPPFHMCDMIVTAGGGGGDAAGNATTEPPRRHAVFLNAAGATNAGATTAAQHRDIPRCALALGAATSRAPPPGATTTTTHDNRDHGCTGSRPRCGITVLTLVDLQHAAGGAGGAAIAQRAAVAAACQALGAAQQPPVRVHAEYCGAETSSFAAAIERIASRPTLDVD
jgi:hypothetical protein